MEEEVSPKLGRSPCSHPPLTENIYTPKVRHWTVTIPLLMGSVYGIRPVPGHGHLVLRKRLLTIATKILAVVAMFS